jgi:hypothetical protein
MSLKDVFFRIRREWGTAWRIELHKAMVPDVILDRLLKEPKVMCPVVRDGSGSMTDADSGG